MANPQHNAEILAKFFQLERRMVMSMVPDPSINGPDPPQIRQHKKALLCTLLDGLGAINDPKAGNRTRFERFVTLYCGFAEAELVSAPILHLRLAGAGTQSPLVEFLSARLGRYDTQRGNSLPLKTFDLSVDDIAAGGASEQELIQANSCRHVRLLYRYRNYLVHEFRSPGYAMEAMAGDPAKPYYHSHIRSDRWVLGYPLGFFDAMAEVGIERFCEHLVHEGIDPYSRVPSSELWQ